MSSVKKDDYYCGFCTNYFNTKQKLQNHTRRKHPNRTFLRLPSNSKECIHCGQNFEYSNKHSVFFAHIMSCYLNPERRWRGNITGFRCSKCLNEKGEERKFSRKDNLLRHIKKQHEDKTSVENEDKMKNVNSGSFSAEYLEEKITELTNGEIDPLLLIDVTGTETKEVKRLNMKGVNTRFHFTELCRVLAMHGFFINCLVQIFDYLIIAKEIRENYLIGVSLESPSDLDYPIPMPFQKGSRFKVETFLNQIEMVMQSHSTLGLSSDLILNVISVPEPQKPPAVGALNPKHFHALEDYLERKKSLLDVRRFQTGPNNENICLALCLALRIYETRKNIRTASWYINRNARPLPKKVWNLVCAIYGCLGLEYNSKIDISNDNFQKIQHWLSTTHKYNLVVHQLIGPEISNNDLIFTGEAASFENINILLFNEHCYLVCSEKDLCPSRKRRFCMKCDKRHLDDDKHGCFKSCLLCFSGSCSEKFPDSTIRTRFCKDCSRLFKNDYCFRMHETIKTCEKLARCTKCFKTMNRKKLETHLCGRHRCRNCCEFVQEGHKCFIQPVALKNTSTNVYIFFDIESMIVNGKHIPNLLVLYRCCTHCVDALEDMEPICCGGNRRHIYQGTNCVDQAINFMFFQPQNKKAIIVAHFGSGYDFQFILQAFLKRGQRPSKLISRDLRILSLTAGQSCTLKDSYLWFRCKLQELSRLWSIELTKSFFPHSWNTPEKQNYEGDWPEPGEFNVVREDREKFNEWYLESKKKRPVFKLQDELLRYCEVDVALLYKSCSKFRRMVLENDKVDPLLVSMSIASLTSFVYRLNYMKPNSVPHILDKDTKAIALKQQSDVALKFLSWLAFTKYPKLIYAGNGPEKQFGKYRADGYDELSNKIIEINGCMIHGCPLCTNPNFLHPFQQNKTNNDVYETFLNKMWDLERNHNVEVYWEHDIHKMLKNNDAMSKFFEDRTKWKDIVEPIASRDCLYGGRVEAFVLLTELTDKLIDEGYRIRYLDIVSLYPTVQRDEEFPVSHPIIKNSFDLENQGDYPSLEYLKNFFGVASVVCYGPQDLHIPILPVKHPESGRLIFPLCGPCGFVADQSNSCSHKGEERNFSGVFTTPELICAMEHGYVVVKIKQVWHFESRSNEIFSDYMTHYAKHKYCASGWPSIIKSEDEKTDYLTLLKIREHIHINKDEIEENIPKRTWSKANLVNLWGKLTTRLDKMGRNIQYISDKNEFEMLLMDQRRDLIGVSALLDTFAVVEIQTKDHYEYSAFHNPVIAAFVTSYGRLRLLRFLLSVKEHVIYCDTDSIIYMSNVNTVDPLEQFVGPFFGQLKNELGDDEDYIKRWVCLGSKSYAYETQKGKFVHKTKGLVVCSNIKENFNFNLIKAILLGNNVTISKFYGDLFDKGMASRLQDEKNVKFGKEPGILLNQPRITGNFKKGIGLENKPELTKFLRLNFTKRKVIHHKDDNKIKISSLPWGYTLDTNK